MLRGIGGYGIGAAYQPYMPAASFDYGQSGRSQNGMISTRDDAAIMEMLMNAQYQEALRNRNNSMPGMGDWQINNIKNEAERYATIRATGQGTSFFSMPQFATPWDKYNEVARLDTNRSSDLDGIMRSVLGNGYEDRVGYNTGQRWSGLQQLAPYGTSFGGGVNMAPGGGYERNISNTAPSDPNRPSAFSNPYNGGRPMGSGSYLGGPGGPIPYGQPFGSTGTARGYNSFGPGSTWSNQQQRGNSHGQIMREREPGQWSPYPQNQPDRMLDMYRYGSNRFGATAVPYGPPSTVDYRMQPQSYTQKLQGDVNNFTTGATGALRSFNTELQGSMGQLPASLRGEQMSRDMGVFGFGDGRSYMPRDYAQGMNFNAGYMGPYSPAFYNNAMTSAGIYAGLLGSGRRY